MNVGKKDIMLSKEGRYWTMYIGEHQCGCGFLDDMIEEVQEVGERLDKGEDVDAIIAEYEECR